MVSLSRLLGYTLFFVIALIYFMPKISMYYFFEKELQNYKIVFSKEEVVDQGLSLELSYVNVSYDGIDLAKIQSIETKLFLIHNTIELQNIALADFTKSTLPSAIDTMKINYSIWEPLEVNVIIDGQFGHANGTVQIMDKNMTLTIEPSELMLQKYTHTLSTMKKNTQGSYEYEKTF